MLRDIKIMLKLTAVLFKGSSYTSGSKGNGLKKNGNKWLYPVLAICLLPMLASMVIMVVQGYGELSAIGKEFMIIRAYLNISVLLTLFMGFFYSLSVLFFATDNEFIAHLPLKPWQISGARFLNILIYEYIFEAFVFLPFAITYGVMDGAGVMFYIYSLIVAAVLPVVPVALMSIVVMFIMYACPFLKSRDRMNVLSTALMLIFMLVFYLPAVGEMSSSEDESVIPLFEMLAGESGGVGKTLGMIVPTLLLGLRAIHSSGHIMGLVYTVLTVAVAAAAFVLFELVSKLIYAKASSGITQATASRKKLSAAQLENGVKKSSAIKSLVIKEIRVLMRTPVYFMNCVLMTWIWPVFFCIGFVTAGSMEDLMEMVDRVSGYVDQFFPYILMGISMVNAFIVASSSPSASAISREGTEILLSKMLPVPYYTQLKAKLYSSCILCGAPSIVLFIALAVVLRCSILQVLAVVVVSAASFFYVACLGLLVDMGRPKLVWTNEEAAVKQNINSLIAMGLATPMTLVVCGGPLALSFVNHIAATVALAVLSVVVCWLMLQIIKVRADKCYDNIQM